MDSDYKRFCLHCNWNDSDYGCCCPAYEEFFQCKMYVFYHPEKLEEYVQEYEKSLEEKKHVK